MSHNNQPTEHQEQCALVNFLRANRIPHFAVPNGGIRDPITARRLKESGTVRGVPDVFVLLPHLTLAIEMKTRTGGVVSKEQKEWGEFFSARENFAFSVCHGAGEAIKYVKSWIK